MKGRAKLAPLLRRKQEAEVIEFKTLDELNLRPRQGIGAAYGFKVVTLFKLLALKVKIDGFNFLIGLSS